MWLTASEIQQSTAGRAQEAELQRLRDGALAARRLQALQDAREHVAGIASKPNERGYNDHKEPLEVRVREELRVARWLMGESRDGDF